MKEMTKILVIVPAYNEAAGIAETIGEIREKAPGTDILVVNDGSGDGTGRVLERLGQMHLDHCLNLGIGGAVQSGYKYAERAGYEYAVQIDGDGQHDPAYIMEMIAWMQDNGIDMGIGSRFLEYQGFQSSLMRRAGIRFLSGLVYLSCGVHIHDVTSGFRIVNRRFIRLFAADYSDDFPETDSIPRVVRCGGKVAEYPVVMRERMTGRSSIDLGKSMYYMVKVSLAVLMNSFILRKPADSFFGQADGDKDDIEA